MKVEGVSAIRPAVRNSSEIDNRKRIRQFKESEENMKKTIAEAVNEQIDKTASKEQEFIKTVEKANTALKGMDKRFEFSIHEATNEIMVKVIDDATDEIIREIPPEKILDMVAKMWELVGIMIDRKI